MKRLALMVMVGMCLTGCSGIYDATTFNANDVVIIDKQSFVLPFSTSTGTKLVLQKGQEIMTMKCDSSVQCASFSKGNHVNVVYDTNGIIHGITDPSFSTESMSNK